MYLYYDEVLESETCSEQDARDLGKAELMKTKNALMKFHGILNDSIDLRESISNKNMNGHMGTFQKFHVIKEGEVVEILDFFWSYGGSYIHSYTTHPDFK